MCLMAVPKVITLTSCVYDVRHFKIFRPIPIGRNVNRMFQRALWWPFWVFQNSEIAKMCVATILNFGHKLQDFSSTNGHFTHPGGAIAHFSIYYYCKASGIAVWTCDSNFVEIGLYLLTYIYFYQSRGRYWAFFYFFLFQSMWDQGLDVWFEFGRNLSSNVAVITHFVVSKTYLRLMALPWIHRLILLKSFNNLWSPILIDDVQRKLSPYLQRCRRSSRKYGHM